MPPRLGRVTDRSPGSWYATLTPVTRLLFTTYVVTGLGTMMNVIPLQYMYLDWSVILTLKRIPQVWRLLACFSFIGKPSMSYLFQLVWLIQYGGSLEASEYQHNTADAMYMLLVGMFATLAFDFILPIFRSAFHGGSLIFMLLYLWSKRNQNSPISIFGLIQLQGMYLPFAFMAISMIAGGPWLSDLLGILSGHVYYFLRDVYPLSSGRQLLNTPSWLVQLMHTLKFGSVPIQHLNPAYAQNARFQAFRGRSRRLVD